MKKTLILAAALLLSCGILGAQEKVRPENEKTQFNTVFDLLRNEPGVQVGPGGDDGTMPDIIIRGISTNTTYTQPLFVVDGIITDNVTYLRPEDIYSVEVLKDGTASLSLLNSSKAFLIPIAALEALITWFSLFGSS